MPLLPALTGLAVLVASTAWAIRVVAAGTPLSTHAAALLGLDVVVVASVTVAGLLVARSRWSRRMAVLLLAFQLAFLPALPSDGWRLAVLALSAVALVLVVGPWLRGWLRLLPNADGPPASIVILILSLLTLPAVAALANPTGAAWGSWLLALVAVVSAWAYGRAKAPALWFIRVGLAPTAIAALAQSTPIGAAVLGAAVIGLVGLSWTREASLVVRPLLPQRGQTYAIPPELVPPEVLRAAGYDERGRPLRDP